MEKNKTAIFISRLIEMIELFTGIIIVFVFVMCTIASILDAEIASDGFLFLFIILDIIGVIFIRLSIKRAKLYYAFQKYFKIIMEEQKGSIVNIANKVGTSQEVVLKNLQKMLKRRFFANAYINYETNRICVEVDTYGYK